MTASVSDQQWDAVRESVRTTTGRFCELVSSIPDSGTKVTAKWSVADMTAHVTTIAFLNTMLLQAAANSPTRRAAERNATWVIG